MQLRTGLQDSFTVERKLSTVLWAVAYPMYGSGADHSESLGGPERGGAGGGCRGHHGAEARILTEDGPVRESAHRSRRDKNPITRSINTSARANRAEHAQ